MAMAAAASTTGTALGTMQGSWRPFTSRVVTFLVEMFSVSWGCATAGGTMNKDYYDAFYLFRQDAIGLEMPAIEEKLSILKNSFINAVNTLYNTNKWDNSAWPAYGTTNQEG